MSSPSSIVNDVVGDPDHADEMLTAAVAGARSLRQVLVTLGLSPQGGNYETVRRRIASLGIDAAHLTPARRGQRPADCSDEDLRGAVRSCRSFGQVLERLGIRPGGNQSRLKDRIAKLDIDTSHFVGQGWRRGSGKAPVPARPLDEVLVSGRWAVTSRLRARLIAEGLKEARCEVCRRVGWNGAPIPLELDHANGQRDDNRLVNLRILCPNCHAQTPTYRGRNIGVMRSVS
jgi:hypothetical protein